MGLWAPKKASQDKRINALVCALGPNPAKLHSLGGASLGDHYAPPVGHQSHGCREMFGINNQQGLVDDLAIGSHLTRQPIQGIGLSLDFDASDVAVDDGDIDPAATVIEAEFVDNQGVWTGLGVREQPPIGGLPDITVPKRSRSHEGSIAAAIGSAQRPILRRACHGLSACRHVARIEATMDQRNQRQKILRVAF